MTGASTSLIHELRPRIVERRERLEAAARGVPAGYVDELLAEVDATLAKIDSGNYGLCETCHDPIEVDRLQCNPLIRFCLDHLSHAEMRAHEQDLQLATEIQTRLLPPRDLATPHWQTHYRYEPAGMVGGDYCEIVPADGSLFFALGDVAGKGVAASLLMTHLNAIFRSLLSVDLPLTETIARANRLFCESTPATHYATLVAGRATEDGIELCNAGHCRPLLLGKNGTSQIDATGVPLGLFCESRYTFHHLKLDPGESLILYTDGVTEAQDPGGDSYDEDRLIQSLGGHMERDAAGLVDVVQQDVVRFRDGAAPQDDMTILVVRRR